MLGFENNSGDFSLADYLEENRKDIRKIDATRKDMAQFYELCEEIKTIVDALDADIADKDMAAMSLNLQRQTKALLGEPREVEYYKSKIKEQLLKKGYQEAWYPEWYNTLEDAIYNEIYGFAGISEWIKGSSEKLKESSSCKIIGDRIYFMVDGTLELQPQRISPERRQLLIDTLLLTDTRKNRAASYFEIYLNDGSRVTIFKDNGLTKNGQVCIVFRKYHVNKYELEEQAKRHTIPENAIPFFKGMVKCGYNLGFTGPVRSAKTTMLCTFQCLKDPKLEGLLIESDPELNLHDLMPTAPIMQLVPSEENMEHVITTAKRSDADYVIVGEARNGKVVNIFLDACNMGSRHSMCTLHNSSSVDICYDIAELVSRELGGDIGAYMIKAAKSVNYIINMCSLSDRSQKRLNGVWEIRYDEDKIEILMVQICKYRYETDDWVWKYDIGEDKIESGKRESLEGFKEMSEALKKLEIESPNTDKHVFIPPYISVMGLRR